MSYPKLIENLIEKLVKLPGIGRRSAERMVFWLLDNPPENSMDLAQAILTLKERLHFCRLCNNLSETEICMICSDVGRDESTLCVVESPKDLLAIERSGSFRGHYHVLLGSLAPAEGRGPEELKIPQLMQRIIRQNIREVVIATDPDTEGEMTALYISKELKPTGIKISRIGLGIPVGSSVEFADLSTLAVSFNSRRQMHD
jgi:recombination protein RecR